MEKIVIYGAGGFAREVFQLISDINHEKKIYDFLGFIDDNVEKMGNLIYGFPILGNRMWLNNNTDVLVAIGIGNTVVKRKIALDIISRGIKSPILIHPTAVVGRNVIFGEGSIVCAMNIITVDIRFGKHVILNIGCTVGHDSILDDFVTISPGSNLSGNTHICEGVDIGTGSSLIQGIEVGAWSILGAGSVGSKNIPSNVTAVGVPARAVKEREIGWHQE